MSGEGDGHRRLRAARAPQRVRVTSPRMGTAARPPSRSPAREIAEQTGFGEVYVRSLVRTQLRLALTVIGVTAIVLGVLPLAFAGEPALNAVRIVGVPLPWMLLGVAVYPALVVAAYWQVRAAQRAERDFADIVERR